SLSSKSKLLNGAGDFMARFGSSATSASEKHSTSPNLCKGRLFSLITTYSSLNGGKGWLDGFVPSGFLSGASLILAIHFVTTLCGKLNHNNSLLCDVWSPYEPCVLCSISPLAREAGSFA